MHLAVCTQAPAVEVMVPATFKKLQALASSWSPPQRVTTAVKPGGMMNEKNQKKHKTPLSNRSSLFGESIQLSHSISLK